MAENNVMAEESPIDFITVRIRKVMMGGSDEPLSSLLDKAKRLCGHCGWSDYVTVTLGKSMRWAQLKMSKESRYQEYVSPWQERRDYLDSAGHEIWFTPETWTQVFYVAGDDNFDVALFVQQVPVGPCVEPSGISLYYCIWDFRDGSTQENHRPILLQGLFTRIPRALTRLGVSEAIALDACKSAFAHFAEVDGE